jgi:eukaryotic-like serine/threonine-protein kinase
VPHPNWQSIEELFHRAAELPEAEQAAFLERETAADAALRQEVASLLAADSRRDDAVRDAVAGSAESFRATYEQASVGRRVGDYALVRPLGHGGMGLVYLARRADAAFDKQVAIKFARHAFAAGPMLRRFYEERRILARLEHPLIARLLDAGATDDGEPFVVMEFVEGEKIDEYVSSRGSSVRERLGLFLQVCDAVQHAHRNLIVHRDIKPGNILVTPTGVPKLLDFGIAKLLSDDAPEPGEETSHTARLFTPEYASPEQRRGEPVTTATDVYSLGVLLNVLLTGARPHERAAPARPARGDLSGELRTVVWKAMREEPAERYATVHDLSADVRRFLAGHPVLARPATLAHRVRKFVRRNALRVAAASAAVLAVIALTAFYTARLARERDAAQVARLKAERVSAFMVDLFQYVDPEASRGATITARELLDAAARQLDTALADQPDVRATMLYNIGDVYHKIGLTDEAMPLLRKAMALMEARGTPVDDELAGLTYRLAANTRDPAARESLFHLAALRGDTVGNDVSVNARLRLAAMLTDRDRPVEAETLIRAQLSRLDTMVDRWGDMRSFGEFLLAIAVYNAGQVAEAESLARSSYDRRKRELGPDEPRTLQSLRTLTNVVSTRGKLQELLTLTGELRVRLTQLFGPDHAEVHYAMTQEARALRELGRLAEAESLLTRTVEERRRLSGERGLVFATALRTLARTQADRGRFEQALVKARRAIDVMREAVGGAWSWVAAPSIDLVEILMSLERWDEAETLARTVIASDSATFEPGNVRTTIALTDLARILAHTGRAAVADSILDAIFPRLLTGLSGANPRIALAWIARAEVALALGDPAAADSAARRALAMREAIAPEYAAWHAEARGPLGLALVRQGRVEEGRAMLERAVADLRQVRGSRDGSTRFAERALAESRR